MFHIDEIYKRQVIQTFLPTHIGTPMMIAGTAIAAIRLIPIGAPTIVPNCHNIFFLRLHGFLPQNVQPDGLQVNMDKSRQSQYKLL